MLGLPFKPSCLNVAIKSSLVGSSIISAGSSASTALVASTTSVTYSATPKDTRRFSIALSHSNGPSCEVFGMKGKNYD